MILRISFSSSLFPFLHHDSSAHFAVLFSILQFYCPFCTFVVIFKELSFETVSAARVIEHGYTLTNFYLRTSLQICQIILCVSSDLPVLLRTLILLEISCQRRIIICITVIWKTSIVLDNFFFLDSLLLFLS